MKKLGTGFPFPVSAEQRRKMRGTWRPRLKELPNQCASCPFRTGNDKEFQGVVDRLKEKGIQATLDVPHNVDLSVVRFGIRLGVEAHGDFICHGTAYTKDMELRDRKEHRQCPGATKAYREGP
jgi:hypothetical protein